MFDYKLALMTGVDIPIPDLQLVIHQPTIKEISMMGEHDFFVGIQALCIQKDMYLSDENLLSSTTNFQVFMAIVNEQSVANKKEIVLQTLMLLFPNYKVVFTPRSMMFIQDEVTIMIDEGNFNILQNLLAEQFCLSGMGQEQFNPANEKAREIARKLTKARQKVAEIKAQENSGSMFSQYLSVLTVGIGSMNLKDAMDLTVYQLHDLMERYSLYINWDVDLRSRVAGAKGDRPVENWMKKIH